MKNIIIKMLPLILGIMLNGYNGFAQDPHVGCQGECYVEPDYYMEINTKLPFSSESIMVTVGIKDGIAYYQSDIVLGNINDLLLKGVGVGTGSNKLWANSTIPYSIEAASFSNTQTGTINSAINYVQNNTNLCFVSQSIESDYVNFRGGSGCSSHVGRVGGEQTITLSSGCGFKEIVHEILHAAGVYHEQSRTDRDTYITVHYDNIEDDKKHNFDKESGSTIYTPGDYDYSSIMHYGTHFFSKNGLATITTIPPGIPIGQATTLSSLDVTTVNSLYPNTCQATYWCNDDTQNYGETGVDCGGSCPPCPPPSCFDGIQNQGETYIDCDGPCIPCNISTNVSFDCESGCYNNLTLVCSAISAEEYNGSIVVSNAQITNNGSTTAYNVQIEFALDDSTGEIPLQVWVPSSDIIAEIAPNETATIAPVLNTPDNLDGAYQVRVKIAGTDNSCLSTESLYFGTPPSGESCYDGIQNQGEAGIDCGYPCPPCTINTCDYTITNYTSCQVRIYWKDNQNNNWYGEIIPPYGSTTEPAEDGYIWLAYNNATNALITTYFDVVDCSSPNGIIPADDCSGSLIATCSDGIRNQLETDIDCGGPCPACPTCSDGIQNQNETDIDCGGPCSPCSSNCQNSANRNGNITGSTEVENYILSPSQGNTATVGSSSSATFNAGTYISLNPGFTAEYGSVFNAFIDGCDYSGWKIENEQTTVSLRNYPNPFTGHTTIEFVLSKDSPVTLFVSDMTGRKVAMLLDNETQTQGTHLLAFDGSNYPAGMYYYTIQAGEYIGTQKMILVK